MSRSGRHIIQQKGYRAFIPTPLPPTPTVDYDSQLLGQADIALGKLDTVSFLLPNIDYILAMYVRKEALLSSQIEGTQASLEDIFDYESHLAVKNVDDIEEVVNYIRALNFGIKKLDTFPMSVRLIKEIHEILLSNVRGQDKTPGEFRRSQNWIAPAGVSLKDATFVPPPPHEMIEAMGQLELFLHKEQVYPALVSCALIHYQFETIHPFLDGNGRLGRLLITFYLYWKQILQRPLLYLSYYFKMHRQEYYDRLNLVREKGDYEQWVAFFLKGVIWTSHSALDSVKRILAMVAKHKQQLVQAKISTPLAMNLLDCLFAKPYLSIQETAEELQVSYPTAQSLVLQFEKANILKEMTGKKRARRFCYWEYVECLAEGTQL